MLIFFICLKLVTQTCILGFMDDFGGAINDEILGIWIEGFLTNNAENPIDMDKVWSTIDKVLPPKTVPSKSLISIPSHDKRRVTIEVPMKDEYSQWKCQSSSKALLDIANNNDALDGGENRESWNSDEEKEEKPAESESGSSAVVPCNSELNGRVVESDDCVCTKCCSCNERSDSNAFPEPVSPLKRCDTAGSNISESDTVVLSPPLTPNRVCEEHLCGTKQIRRESSYYDSGFGSDIGTADDDDTLSEDDLLLNHDCLCHTTEKEIDGSMCNRCDKCYKKRRRSRMGSIREECGRCAHCDISLNSTRDSAFHSRNSGSFSNPLWSSVSSSGCAWDRASVGDKDNSVIQTSGKSLQTSEGHGLSTSDHGKNLAENGSAGNSSEQAQLTTDLDKIRLHQQQQQEDTPSRNTRSKTDLAKTGVEPKSGDETTHDAQSKMVEATTKSGAVEKRRGKKSSSVWGQGLLKRGGTRLESPTPLLEGTFWRLSSNIPDRLPAASCVFCDALTYVIM